MPSPTRSSRATRSNESLHMGHLFVITAHWRMQSKWNTCEHAGKNPCDAGCCCTASWQITHSKGGSGAGAGENGEDAAVDADSVGFTAAESAFTTERGSPRDCCGAVRRRGPARWSPNSTPAPGYWGGFTRCHEFQSNVCDSRVVCVYGASASLGSVLAAAGAALANGAG